MPVPGCQFKFKSGVKGWIYRDASHHNWHVAVARVIVCIISVHGLLRAPRLYAEPDNASDLRLAAHMQLLLPLPIGIVTCEHLVRHAKEDGINCKLCASIRLGQDAVGTLRRRGKEAGRVLEIRVEGRLEVLSNLLAQLPGHKVLDNHRTIPPQYFFQ